MPDENKYKLIIVDDEEVIRNGLTEVVDWEKMGFHIVGVFEDGKEAAEYIKHHPSDVILTDILMHGMSGLELAEYVWKSRLDTKVVILTGYKDFEYAKTACRYGVSFYLLKPTDINELCETFERLKEQLDFERRKTIDLGQFVVEQRQLFSYLFSEQEEEAKSLLSEMITRLEAADPVLAANCASDMFALLYKKIYGLAIFADETLFDPVPSEGEEISLEEKCLKNISEIIVILHENTHKKEHEAVRQAKDFIEKNYQSDILLDNVAREVFLSPTYLSRIFKQHTGENYTDFLSRIRINKAKVLLNNPNLKMYEIAEKVGVRTPKYFFRLFKEYTGMTPTEYRKKLSGNEEQ